MAWWLKGSTSRHFGWVQNSSKAIFSYFWSQGKNQKFFFSRKYRFFSGKICFFPGKKSVFFLKKRRFFSDFFTSDFSFPKSFPTQPKTDFSPKNQPKKMIFLSLVSTEPYGNDSYHVAAISLIEKGKRCSFITSGLTPFSLTVFSILRNLPRCSLGSSMGWPVN